MAVAKPRRDPRTIWSLTRDCLIHCQNGNLTLSTMINTCFRTKVVLLALQDFAFSRFVWMQEEQQVNQPPHSSNNAMCYIWCTCAVWLKTENKFVIPTPVRDITQFIITSPSGSVIINALYPSQGWYNIYIAIIITYISSILATLMCLLHASSSCSHV